MLHDVILNNAWYELGTDRSSLNKFQVPGNDDKHPMKCTKLQNTIVCELSIEHPKAPGEELMDLNNTTCLSNWNVIYSKPGNLSLGRGWKRVTSRIRHQSKFKVLELKKEAGQKQDPLVELHPM